ncbi:hypothetical protein SAMN04487792_0904 [Lactobacillus bombicola]|uniref:DUF1149 family protein n=1 Tax=Lactobacillus bombicola TaxID=1505723 RepID=A0A1I1SMK2_9LACO|nr:MULTISPECIES: DUF1149 family protein [Lactobacillus]MCO6527715.1 DUF1149 family protein [Lactobacillus sp.]RHW49062.1 DUF1149 family protein [Lactobacillus bombicola]RHW53487.1 DUF1149 family protein [Lactobacillus bombicola]RHW54338.1 DUF1149 family protein [Lactobacillus bombicola]RMC40763.1 DUF1149 family protein [Lactobacillus sp. ESL0237]
MDYSKETPILVKNFHYDINEELQTKNQVNFGLKEVEKQNEDGSVDEGREGKYFDVTVIFEVAPAPGQFTVSGMISQIVQIKDYFGDGSDLAKTDYQLLSRPLIEYIETLTYEVTQITLDEPVNLNFQANF